MNPFERAAQTDRQQEFRQRVMNEIASAIRDGTLSELLERYPNIPSPVLAEAQQMADLKAVEAWWKTISISLPSA